MMVWKHGPPTKIFKITHFETESEVIVRNIIIGVIPTLAVHILCLFIYNYISTSIVTRSHLLSQMTWLPMRGRPSYPK